MYTPSPRSGYASFYTALFDLWYPTLAQGRPMSIKLFDDLLALLAFGQETACGHHRALPSPDRGGGQRKCLSLRFLRSG